MEVKGSALRLVRTSSARLRRNRWTGSSNESGTSREGPRASASRRQWKNHPHVHMIVPGGGISLDGTRWVACRSNFLLSVEVLSCLFRRLVLEKLIVAHQAGQLQ